MKFDLDLIKADSLIEKERESRKWFKRNSFYRFS